MKSYPICNDFIEYTKRDQQKDFIALCSIPIPIYRLYSGTAESLRQAVTVFVGAIVVSAFFGLMTLIRSKWARVKWHKDNE